MNISAREGIPLDMFSAEEDGLRMTVYHVGYGDKLTVTVGAASDYESESAFFTLREFADAMLPHIRERVDVKKAATDAESV